MAHSEQIGFVRLMREMVFPRDGKVLEIGSCQVNQIGRLREIFSGCDYTGVDLVEGPGVDVVASGHDVDLPAESFDVTISAECFEHNPFWRETFANMVRMTKPSGIVIMTCASIGRIEHGTTRSSKPTYSPGTTARGWNYYRNLSQKDFDHAFRLSEMFYSHRFFYVKSSHDLYFFGIKRGGRPPVFDIAAIKRGVDRLEHLRNRSGAHKVVRAPLGVLSRVLPDRHFQGIAVPYAKALSRLATAVGIDV
jgi:SAM-dependent methyltransferase